MKTNQPASQFAKQEYEKAIKKSVSMPGIMFNQAVIRAKARGFSTFSDYIQDLMRHDQSAVLR